MFKNYLRTAYRNLVRNKVYSLLNILGLTIGITCFSLIALHLENDFSFDQFHENESYRLLYQQETGDGNSRISGLTTLATGEELSENVAGINERLFLRDFTFSPTVLNYKDKHIKSNKILFAEGNFFNFFSFEMLQGNPETALYDPKGVVLTESMAETLFGQVNPMGEFIEFTGPFTMTLQVTGVMEDTKNTHFDFDFIFPFEMQPEGQGIIARTWLKQSMYTFLRLEGNTNPTEIEGKIKDYLLSTRQGADLEYAKKETPILQPSKDIYFGSSDVNFDDGFRKGDKQNLLILGAIGAFILLVACINYVNISTAKAMTRAKEIGVRKVLGAFRKQLVVQFMGEAFLMCLIAILLSVLLTDVAMPGFSNILGKSLTISVVNNPFYYEILFALLVGVTLISGLYPSFILSAFKPTESLKGTGGLLKGGRMRQALIGIQLFVTLVLISSVTFVMKQANFINQMDLGFQKEDIINIPLNSSVVARSVESYSAELKRNPNVLDITMGTDVIGFGSTNNSFYAIPEGKLLQDGVMATYFSVGMDFLDVHQMEIVDGRKFNPELSTDSISLVINETLADALGFDDPIGEKIKIWGEQTTPQTIIGVVKDFNFQSLHSQVNPALFTVARRNMWNLVIRVAPGSAKAVIQHAQERWEAIDEAYPFEYQFVDDMLDNFYASENRMLGVIQAFAIICIVIACMGLYGMTAFTIEQRIKEIGIRKVLGAGVNQLVWLVNQKFVWLFMVAILVSVPLVYYMIQQWLGGFAYHTNIDVFSFAITGLVVLLIVLSTVSAQAIKAAWNNPTKTLRHE